MGKELEKLRAQLRQREVLKRQTSTFSFGASAVDQALMGGLARGALHEIAAETCYDAPSASSLATILASRAGQERPIVWVRDDGFLREIGAPYAPGLAEQGVRPEQLILVRARNALDTLRAAAEAARCTALGAVLIEVWGAPKALDLTATRRLALAAHNSGVTLVMMRAGAQPAPSAALTRWGVRASPSRPLEANAPGGAACALTLQHHKTGPAGRTWIVEWKLGEAMFRDAPPLSGGVVSLSNSRPRHADEPRLQHAG